MKNESREHEKNTKSSPPDNEIPVLAATPQHTPVEEASSTIQNPPMEKHDKEAIPSRTDDFSKQKVSQWLKEPLDTKHPRHRRSGSQRIEDTSVIVLDPVERMISTQKIEAFQRERKQSVQSPEEKTQSHPYPAWRSSRSQQTLKSTLENRSNDIETNLKLAYRKANTLADKLYVFQYAVNYFWQQALLVTRWSAYPVDQHPITNLKAWNQKFLTLLKQCSHQKDKMYIVEQTQEFWSNLLLQKQPHHNQSVYAFGIAELEFWKQHYTLDIKQIPRPSQQQRVVPSSSAEDMKLINQIPSEPLRMAQQEEIEARSELKSTSFFRFGASQESNATYSASSPLPEIDTEIIEDLEGLEKEAKAIVQQIERLYPLTRHLSSGTGLRLISTNPNQELHRNMQQLDQFYKELYYDTRSQRLLANVAYLGWVRLQTRFSATNLENDFIQKELEIWRQRQQETRANHKHTTSSSICCCTIS